MKRIGLIVSALLFCAAAAPVSQVTIQLVPKTLDDLAAYPTLKEAAVAGAERLYKCSHYYECYAVLALRPDGKYVVGPMHSSYSGDRVSTAPFVPLGWTLVADIHSHPCLPSSHDTDFFSDGDIADNLFKKITGFMLDQCSGEIHEFIPGVNVPNDTQTPDGELYLTRGTIIGKIAVDGKNVEPDTGF